MARGIKRLGPQEYAIRIRFTDARTGKQMDMRKTISASSMRDAEAQRVAIRARAIDEIGAAPRTTLGGFAVSWLRGKQAELAPSTLKTYAYALDHMGTLQDIYIDAIVPMDIIRWRDTLTDDRGRPMGAVSVNNCLRVLTTVFTDANRQQVILTNPAAAVKGVRSKKKRSQNQLTPDELAAVMQAARRVCPNWHAFFATLAATGGRFGEVTALRWEHVDYEAAEITIMDAQWRGVVKETKTDVVKVLPLPDELARLIKAHRAAMLLEQNRAKLASGLVFPSRVGRPIQNGGGVRKPWQAALDAAGVTHRVTLQGLRRTFNNIIRQAAGSIVAQSMMGHVTDDMTEHYSHVGMDERRKAAAPVAKLLGGE